MLSSSTKSTPTTPPATQSIITTPTIKKVNRKSFLVNFIAGGVAGTTGVILTSPLDVVQTRLQSSFVKLTPSVVAAPNVATAGVVTNGGSNRFGFLVYSYMKHIVKTEGFFGLYKGLVPNLMGIAPSRAAYFAIYSKTKGFLTSTHLANSSWTHMLSALAASWSVSTLTNPIWFVKTRMQLDLTATGKQPKIMEVVRDVFKNEGISGFYRGLCASYVGASETMIYFVLYEKRKPKTNTNGLHLLSILFKICSYNFSISP